jgi:CheY-like chemotaxis protein
MGMPLVLVIEDDQDLQGPMEEALIEGGFEVAIAASGEEAVMLLKNRLAPDRALVTDINLTGTLDGWEVAKTAREIDPAFPIVYISGGRRRAMAISRCTKQHPAPKALRAGAACHRRLAASQ